MADDIYAEQQGGIMFQVFAEGGYLARRAGEEYGKTLLQILSNGAVRLSNMALKVLGTAQAG